MIRAWRRRRYYFGKIKGIGDVYIALDKIIINPGYRENASCMLEFTEPIYGFCGIEIPYRVLSTKPSPNASLKLTIIDWDSGLVIDSVEEFIDISEEEANTWVERKLSYKPITPQYKVRVRVEFTTENSIVVIEVKNAIKVDDNHLYISLNKVKPLGEEILEFKEVERHAKFIYGRNMYAFPCTLDIGGDKYYLLTVFDESYKSMVDETCGKDPNGEVIVESDKPVKAYYVPAMHRITETVEATLKTTIVYLLIHSKIACTIIDRFEVFRRKGVFLKEIAYAFLSTLIGELKKRFTVHDFISLVDSIRYRITHNIRTGLVASISDLWEFLYMHILSFYETVSTGLSTWITKLVPKAFSEAVELSDSITYSIVKYLTSAFTVAISDTYQFLHRLFAGISETLTARLSTLISKLTARAFTDTMSLVEAFIMTPRKVLSETISLLDSITAKARFHRLYEDVASLVDSIIKKVTRFFAETSKLSDTIVVRVTRFLNTGFTTTISDIYEFVHRLFASATETVSTTLTTVMTRLVPKAFSETVSLGDSITYSIVKYLSSTFTSAITDTYVYLHRLFASISETVSTALSTVISKLASKSLEDTIGVSDAVFKKPVKALVESLGLGEVLSRYAGLFRHDSVSLSDSLIKTAYFPRRLADALSLSDTLSRLVKRYLSSSFTSSIRDTYLVLRRIRTSVSESLSTSLSTSLRTKNVLSSSFNASISDSYSVAKYLKISWSDGVSTSLSTTISAS